MFPFNHEIKIDPLLSADYRLVLEHVMPLLTESRRQKIREVVAKRTFNCAVVMENIYDRGNISAVIRSAEAMGLAQVHLIELGEKFKESQRTTAGADKWLEVKKWSSTSACVNELKKQGKQIVVTHLSATSKDIGDVDFTKPSALVLGNEKDGVSEEMVRAADHCVVLPMQGFVQSYNISVAGALCFYHIFRDRVKRQGFHGDLSEEEKSILSACYAARTLDSAADIIRQRVKGDSHGQTQK